MKKFKDLKTGDEFRFENAAINTEFICEASNHIQIVYRQKRELYTQNHPAAAILRTNISFMEKPMEITNDTAIDTLEAASSPLIAYLAKNHHPHVTAIVTTEGVELLEGLMSTKTNR